jgi:hypothetical protein
VLVASTPTDKDKQAGTSGHFRICAGAEPTAANRVRPYPHCPSSGARRSPSVDDGGVSSRCMGGCRLWGSGGGAVAVASRHGRGGPVGTATACRLVGVRQRAGAGDWRLGYGPVCFYAGGQGPAARRVRPWGMGWCCCPSCRWRGGGDSAERCWSSSWPAGWPVPPLPRRRSSGPGHLGGGLFGGRLRQPVPLSGRPGGRRPPLGPVLLYRFGGVLAGGRAKLCRRRGPAW